MPESTDPEDFPFRRIALLVCAAILTLVAAGLPACSQHRQTEPPTAAAADPLDYADPDGIFAIHMPRGYLAQRDRGEVGPTTIITRDADLSVPQPRIEVMTITGGTNIDPARLQTLSGNLFDINISALEESGKVSGTRISPSSAAGRDAFRCDFDFKAPGGPVESGYMLATMDGKHAILITLTAPKLDEEGMKQVEAALATLAFGTRNPVSAALPRP